MSQENMEIPYRLAEITNRRDLEAYLALCDPEIEWTPFRASVEGRAYRGHSEVGMSLKEVWRDWEDWQGDVERVIDLGNDSVVVLGNFSARGRESGAEVRARYGQIWTFRAGKVLRVETFANREEALKAAGLRE